MNENLMSFDGANCVPFDQWITIYRSCTNDDPNTGSDVCCSGTFCKSHTMLWIKKKLFLNFTEKWKNEKH